MALFDGYGFGDSGGSGGILPFGHRWSAVDEAIRNGTFDPQGANGQMPAWPPMAYASAGQPQGQGQGALPPLPPPVNVPSMNVASLPQQQSGQEQPQPSFAPPTQFAQAGPPGFGDRLGAGMMGFANSKGLLPAISNLISGVSTGQRADPQGQLQQQQAATYQALSKMMPEPLARAATLNPELLKTLAPEYFGGFKLVKTGSNPITGDQFMMQGPGGKLHSLESFAAERGSAGGSSAPGASSGMLAAGVKNYNPNLNGDEYLAQFSPEVQAAVKARLNGDQMPTGNPRMQGIVTGSIPIAQKYAMDKGIPYSDALFAEKRKYRTELGSNSANSAGGQAKAFVQGIEHADDLAKELEKLGNWRGLGIPILAQGANMVRQGLSTQQSAIADKAAGIGQTLAGEVGKLFSGSAGGGVHERELTRQRFSTVKSPEQLAAALEATMETMDGGLRALESRRDQILGPDNDVKFIDAKTEAKLASIKEAIARLRGGGASAPNTPAPAAPSAGWTVKRVP